MSGEQTFDNLAMHAGHPHYDEPLSMGPDAVDQETLCKGSFTWAAALTADYDRPGGELGWVGPYLRGSPSPPQSRPPADSTQMNGKSIGDGRWRSR